MNVNNKEEIFDFFTRHRSEIREFRVKKLGLFGSFVRDEQKEESDVDLLVEYEKGYKTIDNFLGLIDYLEKSLGRTVELITNDSISKYLKPHIEKEIEYVNILD